MAQLLSQPTILLVQSPSRFATGSARGSYAQNVWTPGRNANGVINQMSWDLVPSGQWTRVVDTSIFNLDAAVKAINASWRDYGTGGADWDGMVMVWNGCAHDPANARMWFHGGGHADSSNNGLYRFDAYKMAWAIENMPSDTTAWSTGYKGHSSGSTFTLCDESAAAAKAKYRGSILSATNDSAYDELFWDGKPTSRHTYNSLVYCSDRNEIAMACRRLWTYSLNAGTWNYKRLFNDDLTGALTAADGGTNQFGEGTFSMYDEATGDILMAAYGSSGIIDQAAFNLRTKAWSALSHPAARWVTGATVRYGRTVSFVRAPGSDAGQPDYKTYNLDSRTVTQSGNFTFGPGVGDFRLDLYLPTLMYVPPLNRYWFCVALNGSTNMVWHEIDPTTTPWTMKLKTFSGDVPAPPKAIGGGFCEPGNKHMYIPSMNALIYFYRGGTGTTGCMYVYKF